MNRLSWLPQRKIKLPAIQQLPIPNFHES
jgi:hypothetical protein